MYIPGGGRKMYALPSGSFDCIIAFFNITIL
jgi:hypothetical protein